MKKLAFLMLVTTPIIIFCVFWAIYEGFQAVYCSLKDDLGKIVKEYKKLWKEGEL